MARNGAGVYVLPTGQPVVTGATISSTTFNALTTDLANALTTSIASDGQTAMAANLPMGGYKLTGLAAATVAGDAIRFEQGAMNGANADITSLNVLASVNGGQLAGFRNRIINGGMQVVQRGNTAIVNGNIIYGGCDRMLSTMFGFGSGSGTLQQVSIPGTSTGYWNAIASFTTTGTGTLCQYHRIEAKNCQDLNSKIITISALAYQDTGGPLNLTTALSGATAVDNFTSTTAIGTPQVVTLPSGVVTKVAYTLTLGAASATNGLQVGCSLAAAAHTNKNFFIGDWQVEVSAVATPIEQRSYGLEMSLCLRYYQKFAIGNANEWSVAGYGAAGNFGYLCNCQFPTPMRSIPTGTVYGTWTATNCGQPAFGYVTNDHYELRTTITALGAWTVQKVNSGTYFDFTAEL